MFVKACTCCLRKLTRAEWLKLPALKPQLFGTYDAQGAYHPDAEIGDLEMRNCACGSTLTLPLKAV